jgi:hypothetical protein
MKSAKPTEGIVEYFDVVDGVNDVVKRRIAVTRWTEIELPNPNSFVSASLDWEAQLDTQVAISSWISKNTLEELAFATKSDSNGISVGDRLISFGETAVSMHVVTVGSKGCRARRILQSSESICRCVS